LKNVCWGKKKTTSTSSSDAESYNFIDTYVYCVHPKLVYIFRVWWLNHSSLFSGNITPGQILYGV
jgi:hypothetical protein